MVPDLSKLLNQGTYTYIYELRGLIEDCRKDRHSLLACCRCSVGCQRGDLRLTAPEGPGILKEYLALGRNSMSTSLIRKLRVLSIVLHA